MHYYDDDRRSTHVRWRLFGTLVRRFATALFAIVPCMAQLPPGVVYSTSIQYSSPSNTSTSYTPSPTVNAVVTDASGNSYLTGSVWSNGLPGTPGVFQPAYAGGGTCATTPG